MLIATAWFNVVPLSAKIKYGQTMRVHTIIRNVLITLKVNVTIFPILKIKLIANVREYLRQVKSWRKKRCNVWSNCSLFFKWFQPLIFFPCPEMAGPNIPFAGQTVANSGSLWAAETTSGSIQYCGAPSARAEAPPWPRVYSGHGRSLPTWQYWLMGIACIPWYAPFHMRALSRQLLR